MCGKNHKNLKSYFLLCSKIFACRHELTSNEYYISKAIFAIKCDNAYIIAINVSLNQIHVFRISDLPRYCVTVKPYVKLM